jgi:hypothetical protein
MGAAGPQGAPGPAGTSASSSGVIDHSSYDINSSYITNQNYGVGQMVWATSNGGILGLHIKLLPNPFNFNWAKIQFESIN